MRKRTHFGFCIIFAVAAAAASAQVPPRADQLEEIPFTEVKINDAFWAPRREINRTVTIPHSLEMLKRVGAIDNFDLAAAGKREGYHGPVYHDSDLMKALEAASYSLADHPDPELERTLDAIIGTMAAAQRKDGYLNSWYLVNAPDKIFTNLRDHHELYCAGHMIEAAVAHFRATGKKSFLNIVTKYADLLYATFGEGPGKRAGYCGHPEIELALVKLYRATGEKKYLDLATFFITHRGEKFFAKEHKTPIEQYDGSYWQDNIPIRDLKQIVGHAVRAAYLMSGCVDVAAETGDAALLNMTRRVWSNAVDKNLYITGGIGPSAGNEGFTFDYDLPNQSAYQETCASVALALWNHRFNLLFADARYADLVEQSLYNGILAGVSQDGKRFFYVNPLESAGDHHRSEWFDCACCPPNAMRMLASLGSYIYAKRGDELFVNLYVMGGVKTKLASGTVAVSVMTEYPVDGIIILRITETVPEPWSLSLRVPGWAGAMLVENGTELRPETKSGYQTIRRTWKAGDFVEIHIPMDVRRVEANPNVADDRGLRAIAHGPLVYCMEAIDQKAPLENIYLPLETDWIVENQTAPSLPVFMIRGEGRVADSGRWKSDLYRNSTIPASTPVRLIPYYAWDNRQPGAMRVWHPIAPPPPRVGGLEISANIKLSYKSDNCDPEGVRDGVEPKNSGEQPRLSCHFWPHKGGDEWVEYRWPETAKINASRVYWFDDTGRGECRVPKSWNLQYLDGETWKPVVARDPYIIKKDAWCSVQFESIKTRALRLNITMSNGFATGIHEWKVDEAKDE
ncbi:MAG: glycoside hydrolase family 127 protein [Planctomycetes bacterium]|nr:glycoside hydrolase family 127 protein [Planctomycetota bacterium]